MTGQERKKEGWGKENYPYPTGASFIECEEMKCVGCRICQMACSMKHFGVINQDLARIQVRKYLLPISKGIQVTCSQCQKEERECEKACPLDPPAIHYDDKLMHMVLDAESCLGQDCLQCRDACPAKAISIHSDLGIPIVSMEECTGCQDCVLACPYGVMYFDSHRNVALKCDLCGGDPECVKNCPMGAIVFEKSA